MSKYIHYCWFGGKPLNKLAQKCLKSWQKYLPDYEIKRWDESNCDINECAFVKGAYEKKKWAFVADYFRTKALYEYGGIYFDTDMEIIKNIDKLVADNTTFLGVESDGYANVAVWYEKNKNSYLTKNLLKIYQSFDNFDIDNIGNLSIPKLATNILNDNGFDLKRTNEVQSLNHDINVYPRDYFYPLSMHHDDNLFTDNTCMIHYYDASWLSKKQKLEMHCVRLIGRERTVFLENVINKIKMIIKKIVKIILFPVVLYHRKKWKQSFVNEEYLHRKEKTIELIKSNYNASYITLYNKQWFGVTSSTKELFTNLVDCGEIFRKKDIKEIGDAILEAEIKQIVFSAFVIGWAPLCIYLKNKNPNIKLKTFWHGSHSQILDDYGWSRNLEIIHLHKNGIIEVMGTCKKSLVSFYEKQGYNTKFITNKVILKNKPIQKKKKRKEIKIGIYAAQCTDWRKNMYTQIAAASLIENATIDMVPLSEDAVNFAKSLGVKIEGEEKSISRDKLIERMAQDDIVLYVSFSECAPMLPLEALEVNTPCLTGNNHHYFQNRELEKYLVINEEDNPYIIKDKILLAISSKKEINKLFAEFVRENNAESKREVEEFLEM